MEAILQPGGTIDTLNREELHHELAGISQEFFRQFGKGVKYLRFGPFATNVINSSFIIHGSQGIGPREGFAWAIRRITVWGLTSGVTPDIANLFRTSMSGPPIWQFNGNNFAYTFGKLEMMLLPGEHISLVNSGTIAATGQISISGDVLEIAAEEISKIA